MTKEFKVEQSGWYETRDERIAEVVVNQDGGKFKVVGYVSGTTIIQTWQDNGHCMLDIETPIDLIKYLGKERPKRKRVVKMAPVLCENLDGFFISDQLFASEEKAKMLSDFSRWLIDTHAVEVEVEE